MSKTNSKMGSIDFLLFSTIMLLVAIGVIMVYSASSYSAFFSSATNHDSMFYLKKQGLSAMLGVIAMFFTIKIDYHKMKKYTKILMIATVVLLAAVFAFPATNGARRWIRLGGPFSLQPSEIAKYIVVIYMAKSIDSKGEKIKSLTYGVIPYLMVSGFYAGMVLAEKNLSIATVIMMVTLIVLYVAGAKTSHMLGLIGLVGLCGVLGIVLEPYRMARFTSFLNPWQDPKGDGYQLIQSLLALGSGGIWGVGLGRSRQKCYYIPEPHNDFIFSIIGEELGLIGCTIIVILFIVFIWRGIITAVKAKDTYGTLLATGITSVIAVQAIINVAVVTGSMPVTGVPLPFISYGGSSLIFNLIAMGVLLNISRQKEYS
ncbi:stage V sporulation protein E [Clostridium thailandense]|uniref:Probable peptidoglycan glycosyltransferase FtsW n=1 Tax=Clostridium thailandense TaxID=2794346 RepID=A0A949TYM0_9CLOT|nr:stage V sporulation protein E [Clostridium thailandense]MBV7275018.1 stage V sporulation protein E [Clostridium thailandense]MCH5136532.1 stage V sporulation protein E [Clostridiaceae bacterium UIB06]